MTIDMTAAQKKRLKKAVELIEQAGEIVSAIQEELTDQFHELDEDQQEKKKNIRLDDDACALEDFAVNLGEISSELADFIKA